MADQKTRITLTKRQLKPHVLRNIAYDIFVKKEYHSTVAHTYNIKKALVSWIIRNYTVNPSFIDVIELKELIVVDNKMRVTSAAKRIIDTGGNIWNIG